MSWWKKLLNQQSENAAEIHNQAMDQPFVYPDAPAPAVDITTRLNRLEARVTQIEHLLIEMTADD